MKKTIALTAVIAIAAASAAHAGDKKEGDWEAKMEEKFAKIDANNDGRIDRDEYLAYKASAAEKDWDKWVEKAGGDDGAVTLEEAKAHHKAKMAEKKERYKKDKE